MAGEVTLEPLKYPFFWLRLRLRGQFGLGLEGYVNFLRPAFADLLAEQVLWQARAATRRQANDITE